MTEEPPHTCICSAMRHPPCAFCENLSHLEIEILDTEGSEVLSFLRTHYLLSNGEWAEEDLQGEDAIAHAKDVIANRHTYNLPPSLFPELSAEEKRALLSPILTHLASIPVTFSVYPLHGQGFTSAPRPSAQIISLDQFRKERTNGTTRPPK